MELLVSHRAKLDAANGYGDQPLHIAAFRGRAHLIEELLKTGSVDIEAVSRNGGDLTPIHKTALSGHVKAAQVLLDNGAKMMPISRDGRTPLHVAAQSGHRGMVRFLLSRSAEPSTKDNYGRLPIHFAAYSGYIDVLVYLQSANPPSIAARTFDNSSVLHAAASGNRVEMLRHLIDVRVPVNIADENGLRPMHIASAAGHRKIVNGLVKGGASLTTRSKDKMQPLHSAIENGHLRLVQLLVERGVSVKPAYVEFCSRSQECSSQISKYLRDQVAHGAPMAGDGKKVRIMAEL